MKILLFCLFIAQVAGHAILTEPLPRLGLDRLGAAAKKYTHSQHGTNGAYPLSETGIMETCGDLDDNSDKPSVETYKVGDFVTFSWKLTIPHAGNPERVRLAVKYSENDTFVSNILYNEVDNDASGSATNPTDAVLTKTSTFQLEKPCEKCKLQWIWDSSPDGGGYIDCADITINPLTAPTAPPQPTPQPTPRPAQVPNCVTRTTTTEGSGIYPEDGHWVEVEMVIKNTNGQVIWPATNPPGLKAFGIKGKETFRGLWEGVKLMSLGEKATLAVTPDCGFKTETDASNFGGNLPLNVALTVEAEVKTLNGRQPGGDFTPYSKKFDASPCKGAGKTELPQASSGPPPVPRTNDVTFTTNFCEAACVKQDPPCLSYHTAPNSDPTKAGYCKTFTATATESDVTEKSKLYTCWTRRITQSPTVQPTANPTPKPTPLPTENPTPRPTEQGEVPTPEPTTPLQPTPAIDAETCKCAGVENPDGEGGADCLSRSNNPLKGGLDAFCYTEIDACTDSKPTPKMPNHHFSFRACDLAGLSPTPKPTPRRVRPRPDDGSDDNVSSAGALSASAPWLLAAMLGVYAW